MVEQPIEIGKVGGSNPLFSIVDKSLHLETSKFNMI